MALLHTFAGQVYAETRGQLQTAVCLQKSSNIAEIYDLLSSVSFQIISGPCFCSSVSEPSSKAAWKTSQDNLIPCVTSHLIHCSVSAGQTVKVAQVGSQARQPWLRSMNFKTGAGTIFASAKIGTLDLLQEPQKEKGWKGHKSGASFPFPLSQYVVVCSQFLQAFSSWPRNKLPALQAFVADSVREIAEIFHLEVQRSLLEVMSHRQKVSCTLYNDI